MNSEYLFKMALGVDSPWKITDIKFEDSKSEKALNINIDFTRGSRFLDDAGVLCEVHDTVQKTWRHLNFFEHACSFSPEAPLL
jgi:transposase